MTSKIDRLGNAKQCEPTNIPYKTLNTDELYCGQKNVKPQLELKENNEKQSSSVTSGSKKSMEKDNKDRETNNLTANGKKNFSCYASELCPQSLMEFSAAVGELDNLQALFDSGCHVSLIKLSLVEKLGLTIDKTKKISLQGIGDNNMLHGIGSVLCQIKIHGISMSPDKFFVVNDEKLENDLLLGRMFCHKNGLEINPGKRSVKKILDDGSSWTLYEKGLDNNKCILWLNIPCYALKETTIEKNSYGEVEVKPSIDFPNEINCKYCENKPDSEEYIESVKSKKFETIPGLVNSKQMKLYVRSLNPRKKLKLKEEELICRLSTVVRVNRRKLVCII